jgi:aspartyl-tRNA(Asn)/glutamyl-tRNA(Gln) amidotransferase subunit A
MSRDPLSMSMADAAWAIAAGDVTSVALTEAAIARAKALQPHFNAFVRIDEAYALAQARACDAERAAGRLRGPLHGVPLAYKDMFYRKGTVSTCGSALRKDWVADTTATVVEKLDAAGAIQIGTLNMTEFAYGPTGQNAFLGDARNPWNRDHLTGGSSSGSAVSTATRTVFGALGSDTAASVRIPAALCGVTGMKTTHGLVSRAGCMPLSASLDTIGPLTRTVEDNALMLSIIAGHDPRDPVSAAEGIAPGAYLDAVRRAAEPLAGLHIGVPLGYFDRAVDAGVAALLDDARLVFATLGATLVEVPMPDLDAVNAAGVLLSWGDVYALHGRQMRERAGEYSPQTRGRIELSLGLGAQDYIDAQRYRGRALREFVDTVFTRCDAVLAPTMSLPVPKLSDVDVSGGPAMMRVLDEITRLMRPMNVLGLPALAVPCGFTGNGLPCGMQLIGRPFAEPLLYRLGAAYQGVTDWHTRSPLDRAGS